MAKNIIYFDLETKRSFNDVRGDKSQMGISVAVTYSTESGRYHIYPESEMDALVEQLRTADLVVGHNHVEFDYAVLQTYTLLELKELTCNLDTLLYLYKHAGRRYKLDAIAKGSLNLGKTAVGTDALKWWAEYEQSGNSDLLMKIAEYCAYDVKVTKAVYEYGLANGHVKIDQGEGSNIEIEVNWSR